MIGGWWDCPFSPWGLVRLVVGTWLAAWAVLWWAGVHPAACRSVAEYVRNLNC